VLALANNGTAIVLGGYLRYGRPTGLWTVVGRVGQRRQRVAKLSPEGAFPVVTAEGTSGAMAVFEPTGDTLAWAFLLERTETFSKPLPVADPKVSTAPIPAVLAANLKGQFVAAWNDFTRHQNPSYFLRASLGNDTTPSRPHTIVPSGQNEDQNSVSTGIDGDGNAIITWSQFGGPFGGPGDHGLLEATHIHG
jgi:hypothetical protein